MNSEKIEISKNQNKKTLKTAITKEKLQNDWVASQEVLCLMSLARPSYVSMTSAHTWELTNELLNASHTAYVGFKVVIDLYFSS